MILDVVGIVDSDDSRFSKDGIGYKAYISPDPMYDPYIGQVRRYIRIHPARNPGTEGCIGLRCSPNELKRIKILLKNTLQSDGSIPLWVKINGR